MPAPHAPRMLVLVTRGKILAGAERQMLYLAAGVDRGLFTPHVVTFFEGPVAQEARAAGIPTTVVPRRGRQLWQDPTMPLRLWTVLRRLRPDVVYAWLLEANVYASAALMLLPRIPLVLSERGTTNPRNRVGYRVMATALSRRARLIVANSAAGRGFMRVLGIPDAKVRVIPNGVPLARVAAAPDRLDSVRAELRLPPNADLVFNAGRLFAQKDHATLLHAFARAREQRPNAVLAIAGEGDLMAELRLLTQQLGLTGSVRWLGQREDVSHLLAAADVAVLSSRDGEGLSNFLIEALLAGRRVVGTDVGSTADILAGTDGILVHPRDPVELADALVRALAEPDTEAARHARTTSAADRFSVEAYVRQSEEMLLSVVGRPAAVAVAGHA